MRDITLTLYSSAQDVESRPVTRPWSEWVQIFTTHEQRGSPSDAKRKDRLEKNKNGPAVILGEVNGPRRKSNVVAANAIALDIDSIPESDLLETLDRLKQFEYVAYTTHKHRSSSARGRPRIRVVLPFLNSVHPSAYPDVWNALNRLVGSVNDPHTKDISRLHFLPSTFDSNVAESIHHPGKWLEPEDLPDELPAPASADETDFAKTDQLVAIRNKARAIRKEDPLRKSMTALLNKQPFAEPGDRHQVVLQLTMWFARANEDLFESTLTEIFSPSLTIMQSVSPGAPTTDEVWTAYAGAVEKSRAYKQEQLKKNQIGDGVPYADDDLKRIATRQGWEAPELQDRWVIQRDGSAWFLDGTGEYLGPYMRDDLTLAASKILAPAPVRLIELTKSGFRYRAISDVVRECGSLASRVISDMTKQFTTYEPTTQTIHAAVSPIRTDLTPTFDKEIDQWLHLLGGILYSKLIDLISCVPDLDKLLCAVYFEGPKGAGKTMFAHGLAKIWSEGGPAEIEKALSDFNDEIVRCPLIFADEEMPKRYGRQTVTTTLRAMLTTTQRTLKQKYKPTSDLKGAIRLIIAANNAFLLDSSGVSSAQDLEAIAQRFLYVPISQTASDYLDTLPRKKKIDWLNYKIAEHALWLAENHEVKEPGKRFWVEGDVSQMHRMLMTGTKWNSMVCEWLVKYLMNPQPFDTQGTGLIRRQGGELLVNDQAIVDGWNHYMSPRIDAETAKIGAGLRAIAKTKDRTQLRWQGKRIRYRQIDMNHLVDWSNTYNIGDEETMFGQLSPPAVESDGNVLNVKFKSPEEIAGTDKEGKLDY